MAKEAFSKRRELLTKGLSLATKKKIIKTLIWSVALYGAETWTLKADVKRRLEALEMWIWRRMEKIPWTAHVSNEQVLTKVREMRQLLQKVVIRQKNWIGHVLRGDGLLRKVIEDKMEGKRTRGRKRKCMLNIFLEEEDYISLKRRAQDRMRWRMWLPRTCLVTEH